MFNVVFFRTAAGNEPVREWLQSLDRDDKAVIGADLLTVQFGFPIGMPICSPLSGGLYEVRSSLPSRREARVVFFQSGDDLVVVGGLIKKSQKTPESELKLARSRMETYKSMISKS